MDIFTGSCITTLLIATVLLHSRTNRLLTLIDYLTKDKVSLFDLKLELENLKKEIGGRPKK